MFSRRKPTYSAESLARYAARPMTEGRNRRNDGATRGRVWARHGAALCVVSLAVVAAGCGTTKTRVASDQLLLSSAVDDAIGAIDFRPLDGQTVYFDTQYIRDSRTSRAEVGDASAGYVVSSLRQQMAAAGCLLTEAREEADFVVEARVGALGRDESEVIYGVPASNVLGAAASAASTVTAVPQPPTIPEIALARKADRRAAAKVMAFAYHRESRQIVWQSGQAQAESTAEDRWVLGAGPFQDGTIYENVRFAGRDLPGGEIDDGDSARPAIADAAQSRVFVPPGELAEPASHDAAAIAEERPPGVTILQAGHSTATEPHAR